MPRIVQLVNACKKCPNCGYYSGGRDKCRLIDLCIADTSVVAPFCPLPVYPAAVIAGLEQTVLALREPNKYALCHEVLKHVASKLGQPFTADGMGVEIPLRNDITITLRMDYILATSVYPGAEIRFAWDNSTYRIFPDANPLQIEKRVSEPDQEELWQRVALWK